MEGRERQNKDKFEYNFLFIYDFFFSPIGQLKKKNKTGLQSVSFICGISIQGKWRFFFLLLLLLE